MHRNHWNSQLGFILATAGSAVGLGNIWRFPYLAGQNGGGAFLLLYILCVFFLGYFLILSKISFGRLAQSNIFDGFNNAAKLKNIKISKFWGRTVGGLSLFNAITVKSIYVIIISWTLCYLIESIYQLFNISSIEMNASSFEILTSSVTKQLIWTTICIFITSCIIIKGVQKGIEKISVILMPFLFILLIFMAIWMMFIPNASRGLTFYLIPDFTQMGFTPNGFDFKIFSALLLKVLGQVIYSLSMGLGVIFVYGSYLPKKTNIVSSTKYIVALDLSVAIISGLIVMPAVFAFNLAPDAGPSLSFITLPLVFSKMYGGKLLMTLFFALLFIAALTSLISIYEFIVNTFIEKLKLSRIKATLLTAVINLIISFIVLLSFTNTINLKVGKDNLFDFIDKLTGSYTLSITILITSIFMGWIIPTLIIRNFEIGNSNKLSKNYKKYLLFTLRYTIPTILILLIIATIL